MVSLSNRRADALLWLVFVIIGAVSQPKRPLSNFPPIPKTGSPSILRGSNSFARCRTSSPDHPGGAATAFPLTWRLPYSRTMPPVGQFRPLISWAGLP